MSTNTKSRYATKRDQGQQMYGPGCCAHKVTDSQINAAKDRARDRGHFRVSTFKFFAGLDGDCVIS